MSLHICLGLIVGHWPRVGMCEDHNHSKLYHLYCHTLVLAFAINYPTLVPFSPIQYIRYPNIDAFHEKNHRKLVKISHYAFARLVAQANRQLSIIMLSKQLKNEANT